MFLPEKICDRHIFNSILNNLVSTKEAKVWLIKSLIDILKASSAYEFSNTKFSKQAYKSELARVQPHWLNCKIGPLKQISHAKVYRNINIFHYQKDGHIPVGRFTNKSSKLIQDKIKISLNPELNMIAKKNVFDTLSELSEQTYNILFWLKEDIQSYVGEFPDLMEMLVVFDESRYFESLSDVSQTNSYRQSVQDPSQLVYSATKFQNPSTSTVVTTLGKPFKTTYQLSQSLLSDLLSMAHSRSILNDQNQMMNFLSLIMMCCKKLPSVDLKAEIEMMDETQVSSLKNFINSIVNCITLSNTSSDCSKRIQAVLASLAKYSIFLANLIEEELHSHIINLGDKLTVHLNKLYNEIIKHNEQLSVNAKPGDHQNNINGLGKAGHKRKRNESFNQDLYISNSKNRAMEAIEKQKYAKENNKTLKCELQLTSMQNLTSKSSNQALLLNLLKVLINIRKRSILPAYGQHKMIQKSKIKEKEKKEKEEKEKGTDQKKDDKESSSKKDNETQIIETDSNTFYSRQSTSSTSAYSREYGTFSTPQYITGSLQIDSSLTTSNSSPSSVYNNRLQYNYCSRRFDWQLVSGSNTTSNYQLVSKEDAELEKSKSSTTKESSSSSSSSEIEIILENFKRKTLADSLKPLDALWEIISKCLVAFDDSGDANAYLMVQNAVETFFMVHSLEKEETEYYQDMKSKEEVSNAVDYKVSKILTFCFFDLFFFKVVERTIKTEHTNK